MLKTISVLMAVLFVVAGTSARAEGEDPMREAYDRAIADGKTPEEAQKLAFEAGDRGRAIEMAPGRPLVVRFHNGKVIGYKVKVSFNPLRTSLVLSENTCTRSIGTKGEFVVPLIFKSLIPYWIQHPTKRGQPVLEWDSTDKKDQVKTSTAFISRVNDKDFSKTLRKLPKSAVTSAADFNSALKSESMFGWFECPQGKCETILPNNSKILFWDENFETGNEQVTMARGMNMTLNQMSSRLQEVIVANRAGKIYFAAPEKTFGAFATLFPPGISYQVQWTFRAPNLVEKDDGFCLMKWDLDFTRIFTQFTAVSENVENPDKVDLSRLPDYLYDEKDENNLSLNSAFESTTFDSDEVRK